MPAPVDGVVHADDGVALRIREHRPLDVGLDAGVRPPFLLVHGLSSNALLWDGVGQQLAAAGHRSVAVDLRAHGRSDPSDDLDFPRLVADLTTVIAATDLGQPVAVGQSWGGNVVLELGAQEPTLVHGVVGVDGGLIDLASRFPDLASCWEALAPPRFEGLRWHDLAAGMERRLAGWPAGASDAQLGNLMADPTDGQVRAILTRERHRSIVEHLYAHRPLERLPTLEVPMLLLAVTGGGRAVLDEERLEAARQAAGGRLDVVRLPGRDHDVHLQEPTLVAGLIRDWVRGEPVDEVVR